MKNVITRLFGGEITGLKFLMLGHMSLSVMVLRDENA